VRLDHQPDRGGPHGRAGKIADEKGDQPVSILEQIRQGADAKVREVIAARDQAIETVIRKAISEGAGLDEIHIHHFPHAPDPEIHILLRGEILAQIIVKVTI
jgi:hypothetical protein